MKHMNPSIFVVASLAILATACNVSPRTQGSESHAASSAPTYKATVGGTGGTLKLDEPVVSGASQIKLAVTNAAACGTMTVPQIFAQAQGTCLIQSISQTYLSGQVAEVTGLADGTYTVAVEITDTTGNELDEGTAPVTITGGTIVPLTVTLAPPATETGSGGIAVSVVLANTTATATSTSTVALPCGGLTSGESLSQGQSVSSCDGAYKLTLQTDGNLVIYNAAGTAIWSTITGLVGSTLAAGYGAAAVGTVALMQTDGNFVLFNNGVATWQSGTSGHAGATLSMQTDSNLVVYLSSTALWSSQSGLITQ